MHYSFQFSLSICSTISKLLLLLFFVSLAVVFNFNGAEETNWQAAHGFITQHEWRKTLRALVNLEGAGAGGRELVIQTGPRNAWIAQLYAEYAPYPFGATIGEKKMQP